MKTDHLFDIQGKVVVVTGGAGGIGGGLCEILAQNGVRVAIIDLNLDAIDSKVKQMCAMGVEVRGYVANIVDEHSVQEAFAAIYRDFGSIYGLINCAGISYVSYLSEMPIEKWQAVMDVNLRGTVLCTKTAASYMEKDGGGRVINISSLAATHGKPKYTAYTPSKAAVNAFTFTVAAEWGLKNICVNAISPVMVVTDINRVQIETNPGYLDNVIKTIPQGRACSAELLIGTVIFLLSEASSYVTGQCIGCDGGSENGDVFVIRPQEPS